MVFWTKGKYVLLMIGAMMPRIDKSWNVTSARILIDEDLDVDKLGWKGGDYFKLININGQAMLVKADALQRFIESQGTSTLG